jgi:GT2 family glycosyltransferase
MRPTEVETSYDVDVIILSWNRPDDVLDAIASALGQTGVSRRVLIVDQGSEPQISKLSNGLSETNRKFNCRN